MKRILTYTFILLVLASCGRHESSYANGGNSSISHQVEGGEKLKIDVLLPSTPIKDQGNSELCWVYAMLAAIETDHLAMGDSVNLSPLWLARHSLDEQAVETYFTSRRISLRGTLPEAMRLINNYGICAWDAYHPDTNISSRVLSRKIEKLANQFSSQKKGTEKLRTSVCDLLDNDLGPSPRYVFMLGAEYTPTEFAHSVCLPDEWKAYTSFTHHPFNTSFVVEVPDNRQRHTATNIPIDSLLNKVEKNLLQRHPVAWEGCMKNNAGTIKFHKSSAQNTRQDLFERHILTDDHCMTIVGMGHTSNGERYFILKNSWGIHDGNHGYRYMSEQQFVLSTIMVMTKN